ncbi:MAG: hypothetical protein M3Q82_01485 [Actinomycetota bacterium]|nr:hypothetical protein [Actinomycetota bacterium]
MNSAAVEVAQSALDLELRYRPAAVVDIERFHLHAQQLRIDAVASNRGDVVARSPPSSGFATASPAP